ncbi:tripartite tricarboxylate transporter substrate binding protein [Roseomonas gilardii]|uniref:Tripartite tricarboxylate transporter substrate binding protein n=1 Tax=Roseomonas gilardii TaxID=257708 RepID=A0ABU3MLI8_9PROT|nr:tripartite tricarboxylate transporter substrate binding protein [Roseomonas gilardii]MDT8333864.1 tripartite tricarboxylate transporter substrate binding protein [Roseomonas gilardii]
MYRRPALLGALAATLAWPTSAAEVFPARPIRLIIPYPAGGTTDIIARALQEPLRTALGQPIIVENRGGGSGSVGLREVINAAPDGYTLAISNNGPSTILPLTDTTIGYKATDSLSPVSLLSLAPLVLVTSAKFPAMNLQQFIAQVRSQPGKLNYATAGVASFGHVATLMLSQMAKLDAVHIPYRGQAPMTMAVVSGEVQFVLTSYSQAMNEQVEVGKLRRLGISTTQPSPVVPGTPPIADVVPGYSAEIWFGMLAPKATPPDIVNKLNAVIQQALLLPAVKEQLLGAGMEANGSTPQAFGERLASEEAQWRNVLSTAGIKPE